MTQKTLSEIQAEMRELLHLQSEIIKQAVEEASAIQAEIGTRLNGIVPLNPLTFMVSFDGEKVTVSPVNAKRGNSVSASVMNGEKRAKASSINITPEIEPMSAYSWTRNGIETIVERIDDGSTPEKRIILNGDHSQVFGTSSGALHSVTGYNMNGPKECRVSGKRIK